ncbi:MAG TPA: tRNA (N(6)-L-threonylcarbamoyladenosine(37)-C(2))-methylthiotransferase MtaB [Vicinamibacterales bacterium]|nr:tRNA (N(6)-L-threonylcarbamoyladenosine(37)-C(2))-methylthiotransferase MtaB [Vicinamibacterales bacterium]
MTSYSVITFGCRVNQADSLELERALLARGATNASPEQSDIVIVNSCTVTAAADQGVRQTVRRLARSNPHVKIVVTGCYATRRPDDLCALPNVVRVVANDEKERLTQLLFDEPSLSTSERFGEGDDACGSRWLPGTGGRTAMTLRVQTGCDERCSYCIIPKTRGVSRSRSLDRVLSDVGHAIAAGYKEVIVTGVHLGSYGRDLIPATSLTALASRFASLSGDIVFRISSLEPMDCPPELVDLVASSPRLAPHFHLPLQHGSDGMLSAMRRPYTAAYFARLVESIHARIPDASIGTDLIVGFPGETEAQFDETRRLLEQLPLTHLHVFPYSDRPGTEATTLGDKVDGAAIRDRGQALREIGRRMVSRFGRSQVGRTVRGLTVDDGWSAVTPNYLKVKLDRQRPRNEWVTLRIETAEPLSARVES